MRCRGYMRIKCNDEKEIINYVIEVKWGCDLN
jgi:hypothetical protein